MTSEDLIARALAAKEIDYETSLVYRAYAIFGDRRLPRQYATDVIDIDAATELFAEILANKDQLSRATLDTLAPFLARPNDPRSIFNAAAPSFVAASVVLAAPARGTWDSTEAAGGLVRVWTRSDYKTAVNPLTYAGIVDEVWPKLRTLIRPPNPDEPGDPSYAINTDSAIDVYIVPLGGTDPRRQGCLNNPRAAGCKFAGAAGYARLASPFVANTSSGYAIIDASVRGDFLFAAIAHELFHISQFSYNNSSQLSWLVESTATWGEFRVLQELGRDTDLTHEYLPSFFGLLDTISLGSLAGSQEYGAHLYFLYAQMEKGDAVVSDIWAHASTTNSPLDAVDQTFPFKENFREFALRNWNFDPVPKRYEQADPGPPRFPALGPPLTGQWTLIRDQTKTLDQPVYHLTARYYSIQVPADPGIQKVRVRLDDVTGKPDAGVDALLSIEGKPAEVQHWSHEAERTFCLDDPDEKLRQLVLIVSNASMTQDLKGKIEIEPSSQPCWRQATLTVDFTHEITEESGSGSIRETVRATIRFEVPRIDYWKESGITFEFLGHFDGMTLHSNSDDPNADKRLLFDMWRYGGRILSVSGQASYSARHEHGCTVTGEGTGAISLGTQKSPTQFHVFIKGDHIEVGVSGEPAFTVRSHASCPQGPAQVTDWTVELDPEPVTFPGHCVDWPEPIQVQVSQTGGRYTGRSWCHQRYTNNEDEGTSTVNITLQFGDHR